MKKINKKLARLKNSTLRITIVDGDNVFSYKSKNNSFCCNVSIETLLFVKAIDNVCSGFRKLNEEKDEKTEIFLDKLELTIFNTHLGLEKLGEMVGLKTKTSDAILEYLLEDNGFSFVVKVIYHNLLNEYNHIICDYEEKIAEFTLDLIEETGQALRTVSELGVK